MNILYEILSFTLSKILPNSQQQHKHPQMLFQISLNISTHPAKTFKVI